MTELRRVSFDFLAYIRITENKTEFRDKYASMIFILFLSLVFAGICSHGALDDSVSLQPLAV